MRHSDVINFTVLTRRHVRGILEVNADWIKCATEFFVPPHAST